MIVKFQDVVKTYGTGEGMQTAVDHISFSMLQYWCCMPEK